MKDTYTQTCEEAETEEAWIAAYFWCAKSYMCTYSHIHTHKFKHTNVTEGRDRGGIDGCVLLMCRKLHVYIRTNINTHMAYPRPGLRRHGWTHTRLCQKLHVCVFPHTYTNTSIQTQRHKNTHNTQKHTSMRIRTHTHTHCHMLKNKHTYAHKRTNKQACKDTRTYIRPKT